MNVDGTTYELWRQERTGAPYLLISSAMHSRALERFNEWVEREKQGGDDFGPNTFAIVKVVRTIEREG